MMVLRRFPPRRLVITNGPSVVIVTAAAKTTVVTASVIGIVCTVVAFRVANANVVIVTFTAVIVVIGIGAITITAGAQRAADEREQLLHVPVKLVRQAGNAAGAIGPLRRDVTQHVRFEVYGLGVPLLLLRQRW